MTRISDRFVVQRVDEQMVMVDDHTGQEFVFPVADAEKVVRALSYLATADLEFAKSLRFPPLVD